MLEIFYNEIIPEILTGKVEAFMTYNMPFNINIEGVVLINKTNNEDILLPTLTINDKNRFDNLLVEYVQNALEFYDSDNYEEEVRDDIHIKEKIIMTLLWSNATFEDFLNPCEYLRKRINFFKNKLEGNMLYIKMLDSDLEMKIIPSNICMETPYKLEARLINKNDIFNLPSIYFGISDNKAYIYSIQNEKNSDKENEYVKHINRLLYKVNSGYIDTSDLKDITPSFLVVLKLLVTLLKNNGIYKIEVPSILIERWNAKEMSIDYKASHRNLLDEEIDKLKEDHIRIQTNLTDKLLRTFRRLEYQDGSIEINNFPGELSTSLNADIKELEYSNNPLLEELNFKEGKIL